jgi:hypothetical protein
MVTGRSDISTEFAIRVLLLWMSPGEWIDSSRLDTRMLDLSLKTRLLLLSIFTGKELLRFGGKTRVARPCSEVFNLLGILFFEWILTLGALILQVGSFIAGMSKSAMEGMFFWIYYLYIWEAQGNRATETATQNNPTLKSERLQWNIEQMFNDPMFPHMYVPVHTFYVRVRTVCTYRIYIHTSGLFFWVSKCTDAWRPKKLYIAQYLYRSTPYWKTPACFKQSVQYKHTGIRKRKPGVVHWHSTCTKNTLLLVHAFNTYYKPKSSATITFTIWQSTSTSIPYYF